jgi:hypothetical protein
MNKKGIGGVSSTPVRTKKNDELLALICDGSTDRSALQDKGAWPMRISDSFRDFMVKTENNRLQNNDSYFSEDESGTSVRKNLKC